MRARLFLTVCLLPLALGLPVHATEQPVVIKKNFSAGTDSGAPVAKRGGWEGGSFFGGLFGKRRIVIEDVPSDLPAVSNKDPDEGFEVYKPEPLVPLADDKLSGASFFVDLSDEVLDVLRDSANGFEVRAAEKSAILNFYSARGFEPVWVKEGKGLKERAIRVMAKLAAADEHGFEPAHYLPQGMSNFAATAEDISGDKQALARLDVAISVMVTRFADDLYTGRIVPRRLSGYYDIDPPVPDLEAMLKTIADSDEPEAVLEAQAPQLPEYAALKAELARLRELDDTAYVTIPEGNRVKPGAVDARIPALRQRMLQEGWVSVAPADWSEPIPPEGAKLDDTLVEALRKLQAEAGIKVTGMLDAATVAALDTRNSHQRLQTLILNMERMRWLPRELGPSYVFANQAAFELHVVQNGLETWNTRIIVGKPNTQTFVFNEEMETVVFNPTWGVPQSIIVNEMLPELQKDSAYLDRSGYQVTDNQGNVIPSDDIDWSRFTDRVPFNVVQPAGDDNALGEVKFLFPNAHNIYMHDTPTRKLFSEKVRAFSHGCVRVQNPRHYAEILLGWDEAKVASAIASGQSQSVPLPEKLPVYIHYFTAWPDAAGQVEFYPDIYKRDLKLETALGMSAS